LVNSKPLGLFENSNALGFTSRGCSDTLQQISSGLPLQLGCTRFAAMICSDCRRVSGTPPVMDKRLHIIMAILASLIFNARA
jgi:hypothetical protein